MTSLSEKGIALLSSLSPFLQSPDGLPTSSVWQSIELPVPFDMEITSNVTSNLTSQVGAPAFKTPLVSAGVAEVVSTVNGSLPASTSAKTEIKDGQGQSTDVETMTSTFQTIDDSASLKGLVDPLFDVLKNMQISNGWKIHGPKFTRVVRDSATQTEKDVSSDEGATAEQGATSSLLSEGVSKSEELFLSCIREILLPGGGSERKEVKVKAIRHHEKGDETDETAKTVTDEMSEITAEGGRVRDFSKPKDHSANEGEEESSSMQDGKDAEASGDNEESSGMFEESNFDKKQGRMKLEEDSSSSSHEDWSKAVQVGSETSGSSSVHKMSASTSEISAGAAVESAQTTPTVVSKETVVTSTTPAHEEWSHMKTSVKTEMSIKDRHNLFKSLIGQFLPLSVPYTVKTSDEIAKIYQVADSAPAA